MSGRINANQNADTASRRALLLKPKSRSSTPLKINNLIFPNNRRRNVMLFLKITATLIVLAFGLGLITAFLLLIGVIPLHPWSKISSVLMTLPLLLFLIMIIGIILYVIWASEAIS